MRGGRRALTMGAMVRLGWVAAMAVAAGCVTAEQERGPDNTGVVSAPLCDECRAPTTAEWMTAQEIMKARCNGRAPVVDEAGVFDGDDEQLASASERSSPTGKVVKGAMAPRPRSSAPDRAYRWSFHCDPKRAD